MQQLALSEFNSADETKCPTCGRDDFKSQKGMRVHHSQTHGEVLGRTTVECAYCGREFEIEEWRLKRANHFFCPGSGCRGKWLSENQRGEDNPRWAGRITLVCEWCGDKFEVIPALSDQRFCDINCKSAWIGEQFTGRSHPGFEGGKEERECRWCGDIFRTYPSDDWLSCSRECYEKWFSANLWGQDHALWRGGESMVNAVRRLVGPGRWSEVAESVRDKADGECEMCGADEDDFTHPVHHIIPVISGGVHHDDNLMALCLSCHRKVETYTQQFTDPVLLG